MCGIAGTLGADPREVRATTETMCDQMIARGPDDGGVEIAGRDGAWAALGNRRLAIIDPSPSGHQPMRDERGNTLVFNGMIYNYRELWAELAAQGERFTSDCDTEVVLRACGRWGAAATVRRLRGMFAFALYEAASGDVVLARDRLGIKPLYYAQEQRGFLFASQVRALLETGRVPFRLSREALAWMLSFGAVSEPLTAIEGVLALPAGAIGRVRDGRIAIETYWSLPDRATTSIGRDEAARELRARLDESVASHLVADAPAGVFLSGGIDSSVLAALAAQRDAGVRTLAVVFGDEALSEQQHSDLVARHIGSTHERVELGARDLLDAMPGAFAAMDQPSFDGINTYIVSRAAAQSGLKVALSGLGADELFDGYGQGRRMAMLERARRTPALLAPLLAKAGGAIARRGGSANDEKIEAWLSRRGGPSSYGLMRRVFMPDAARALLRDGGLAGDAPAVDARGDISLQAATLDLSRYTRDVLLRDTDTMSMSQSLEVRVPYLDHMLAEWVLALPAHVRAQRGKALLAEAAEDLLPPEVFRRRKQGFVLPIAAWLRGPMREQAAETLTSLPDALAEHLDPAAVAEVWRAFDTTGQRWLQPWTLYALCRWAESASAAAARVRPSEAAREATA